tara:strand:+ start:290 stop:910 length:621 start_codon:yes stop_codon:yes gene_type:complete
VVVFLVQFLMIIVNRPTLFLMKKVILLVSCFCIFQSCIPLRIAPVINDYKVVKGKKFKRTLPKRQMFIFKDTKDAEQFYYYVNTKFELNHIDVYDNVPFLINGETYFFSFYEVEIPDKGIDMITPIIGVIGNSLLTFGDERADVFNEEAKMYRQGNYFIAMEVFSDLEKDCLADNSFSKEIVLKYLRELKQEYIATHNYNEVLFKD